jgi:hypothetical protein
MFENNALNVQFRLLSKIEALSLSSNDELALLISIANNDLALYLVYDYVIDFGSNLKTKHGSTLLILLETIFAKFKTNEDLMRVNIFFQLQKEFLSYREKFIDQINSNIAWLNQNINLINLWLTSF